MLEAVEKAVKAGGFPAPFQSTGPDGEPTMEWWNDPKKVTFYIYPDKIEFVKVWGKNPPDVITDGETTDPVPVLNWLFKE